MTKRILFSQCTHFFIIRPFENSWMFFIFAEALYFISQFFENVNGWHNFGSKTLLLITLYSIADTALLSYIIGFFPQKVVKWLELSIVVVLSAFTFSEIFIFRTFNTLFDTAIIQLLQETSASECSGFFTSYVLSPLGLGCVIGFVVYNYLFYILLNQSNKINQRFEQLSERKSKIRFLFLSVILFCSFCTSAILYWQKSHVRFDMAFLTPSQPVARYSVSPYVITYRPIIRFGCALHNCRILKFFATPYLKQLQSDTYHIKSFSEQSPTVVVIIGESCIYKHMSIYGYRHETTPFQSKAVTNENLTVFKDVVSPACLTIETLRNIFSMCTEENGNLWVERPFYIAYFKNAGYQTTLLSNQYIVNHSIKENDLSGPLLANPTISKCLFDYRNERGHQYDEGLLDDWHTLKDSIWSKRNNLIFLHLLGQHFDFKDRFPHEREAFTKSDYNYRTKLGDKEKQIVADYDNAVLYGDSVIGKFLEEFEDKEAVVIFLSENGEEVYDDDKTYGRQHSATDKVIMDNELHIPFWIWVSDSYKSDHPEVLEQIKAASSNRYITDDLPHTLLYLAGIDCKEYDETRAVISPKFKRNRKRILHSKNQLTGNYDDVMKGSNSF